MTIVRTSLLLAALAGAAVTGGCSRVRGHQGFISDPQLVAAIQPGVDNRESVSRTLGRPSFAGQFDANDWYYWARDTRQYAYTTPKAFDQSVLHVRFDARGNVAAVERTGMDKIASINPVSDKTPTLGRDRNFFQDLFGNIGTVGSAGQNAPTTDNPNGN